MRSTVLRRFARVLAVVPALAVVLVATPAFADTPASWADDDNSSTVHSLLIALGIPVLLFVLITFLVYLPSIIRGQQYDAALAWRDQPEWFGGPRGGADAAVDEPADQDKGGASANW
jgi:hypothetical protein